VFQNLFSITLYVLVVANNLLLVRGCLHCRHMAALMGDDSRAQHIHRALLCTTLGGLKCDLLTITDNAAALGQSYNSSSSIGTTAAVASTTAAAAAAAVTTAIPGGR
jgi:hypothetical protein